MRKLPELQLKDIQTWANEIAAKAQSAMSEVRVCVCVAYSALACPAGLETHSLPADTGGAGRLQGTVPAFVLHQWCPYHRSRGTGCCGCSTDVDVHIHRGEQHILMIRCPNFDGVSASTDEKPIRHDMTPLPGVGLCTS